MGGTDTIVFQAEGKSCRSPGAGRSVGPAQRPVWLEGRARCWGTQRLRGAGPHAEAPGSLGQEWPHRSSIPVDGIPFRGPSHGVLGCGSRGARCGRVSADPSLTSRLDRRRVHSLGGPEPHLQPGPGTLATTVSSQSLGAGGEGSSSFATNLHLEQDRVWQAGHEHGAHAG